MKKSASLNREYRRRHKAHKAIHLFLILSGFTLISCANFKSSSYNEDHNKKSANYERGNLSRRINSNSQSLQGIKKIDFVTGRTYPLSLREISVNLRDLNCELEDGLTLCQAKVTTAPEMKLSMFLGFRTGNRYSTRHIAFQDEEEPEGCVEYHTINLKKHSTLENVRTGPRGIKRTDANFEIDFTIQVIRSGQYQGGLHDYKISLSVIKQRNVPQSLKTNPQRLMEKIVDEPVVFIFAPRLNEHLREEHIGR